MIFQCIQLLVRVLQLAALASFSNSADASQISDHRLHAANQGVSPADARKSVFLTVRITALPAHMVNCRVHFDFGKVKSGFTDKTSTNANMITAVIT